jgi:hypothetical protein
VRRLYEGNTPSSEIGDPVPTLELLSLSSPLWQGFPQPARPCAVENLLLRHQLQIALRSHPRLHLRTRDRFFWLVVRRPCPGWKRDLILIRPETVLRWHRQGWRRCWRWR